MDLYGVARGILCQLVHAASIYQPAARVPKDSTSRLVSSALI
jgi:hypothetical protein